MDNQITWLSTDLHGEMHREMHTITVAASLKSSIKMVMQADAIKENSKTVRSAASHSSWYLLAII